MFLASKKPVLYFDLAHMWYADKFSWTEYGGVFWSSWLDALFSNNPKKGEFFNEESDCVSGGCSDGINIDR